MRRNVEPTVVSYTSVIDAYARSRQDGPQNAERILFSLLEEQLYNDKLRVTAVTCDAVLNAWAQVGTIEAAQRALSILQRLDHMANDNLRPTANSYATVMNAFAKCQAPTYAQDLLENLLAKVREDPTSVKLDAVVFSVAIQAWANSGDPRAGNKAQEILDRMQTYNIQPSTVAYNTVISAWAHSGHVNAALQAEKVLQQMHRAAREQQQQLTDDDDDEEESRVLPNTISYNSVLHAYSKGLKNNGSNSFPPEQRASKLLEFMIRSNNPRIRPDQISFTSVLNAWAKSKQPDRALQAKRILTSMLSMDYLKPDSDNNNNFNPHEKLNAIPFNAVLNACAFSAFGPNNERTPIEARREALQIAVSTMAQLRKVVGKPDTVSYGNLLKCCSNLMDRSNQRTAMSMKIFQQCCNDGMVGELVWNEIRRAVPSKSLVVVLPEALRHSRGGMGSLQFSRLPRQWRRNVSHKMKRKPMAKKPLLSKNAERTSTSSQLPSEPIIEQSWTGKDMLT